MQMPTPPNQRASTLLCAIHSLFFATGDWPSFADVDHYLVPLGEVDAEDAVATMPAGLLYGVTPGQPIHDEQVIGLTVAGMAACASAAEALGAFLAVMRYAGELDLARTLGSDPAQLVSSSLAAGVEMPVAGRSELIRRLGAPLVSEPWGSSGSSQNDEGGWRHTIGRRARRLLKVSTIEEYWELTHPEQKRTFRLGRIRSCMLATRSSSAVRSRVGVHPSDWASVYQSDYERGAQRSYRIPDCQFRVVELLG
jgi:hypothetical protein